jgi:hypothetical protein
MTSDAQKMEADMAELEAVMKEENDRLDRLQLEHDIENWRNSKRPFPQTFVGHVCSSQCHFEQINAKKLFGCVETGATHQCGDLCQNQVVTKEAEYVCSLTGTVLDRMLMDAWAESVNTDFAFIDTPGDATARFGLRKRYISSSKSRENVSGGKTVALIVRNVLQRLLKQENQPSHVMTREQEMMIAVANSGQAYIRRCIAAKTWPNMFVARRIAREIMYKTQFSIKDECSEDRMEHYVTNVCAFWDYLQNGIPASKKSDNHIRRFALAAIYQMQHGIVVNSTRLTEPDPWLFANLPKIQSLEKLKFGKKPVTLGRNGIYEAVRTLLSTGKGKKTLKL